MNLANPGSESALNQKQKIVSIFQRWQNDQVATVEARSEKVYLIHTGAGPSCVLKQKSDPARIAREFRLLQELQGKGLPVAAPIAAPTGEPFVIADGQYYCLYPYLKGLSTGDFFQAEVQANLQLYGRGIATLHHALADCVAADHYQRINFSDHIRTWALPVITKQLHERERQKLEPVLAELVEFYPVYRNLPEQLIHRDPHPGNMVITEDRRVGFIDFEIAVYGVRIFDPAYFALGFLAQGFADPAKRLKWFDIFELILTSYRELNEITAEERKAVWHLMLIIELIFVADCYQSGRNDAAEQTLAIVEWVYGAREKIEEILEING